MLYSYLSKMMKNVCANSKIDSILKFVCVMLTYRVPLVKHLAHCSKGALLERFFNLNISKANETKYN